MNLKNIKPIVLSLSVLLSNFSVKAGPEFELPLGNSENAQSLFYGFSGRFKPGDSVYAKNITLLNSKEQADRLFYMRHTLDLNLDAKYGKYEPAAQMKLSMRNKAKWGTPHIVPTTRTDTKVVDHVGLNHKHSIPRHLFWIKECWLELCINDMADISFHGKRQTFTIGAFPFQLGRGISLGNAYAVGPDYIGFYSDVLVDQYAFGAKLSGEIVKDRLFYDIYGALLNNKCNSTGNTAEKIFAQAYGRINCPERGFGIVNVVIAGRLKIVAVDDPEQGTLTFEPYALYNIDKEQKVEFRSDAISNLGTLGLACEYESERFEFGFEGAFNLGHQHVLGWDRNVIELQNRNGCMCFINSHVYVGVDPCSDEAKDINLSAYKAPQTSISKKTNFAIENNEITVSKEINKVGKTAQDLIHDDPRTCKNNAKLIGKVDGFADTLCMPPATPAERKDELYNAKNRYRDPYKNKYKGFMFVVDGAICFMNKDVKIAATAGYASGDADPNFEQKDGDYKGFIPLQELYSGKRVKSTFYLGGAGKLRRPLDTLTTEEKPDRFAATVSGFTDIAFIGSGIKWEPHEWKKYFSLNPNIFAYWETWADKKFDALQNKFLSQNARRFLGVELNVFMEKELLKNIKFFLISSLFIPGSHYDDVRGKPINKNQQKLIDRLDRTAYTRDCIPNLGTDTAFSFNVGFDYKF